MKPLLLLLSLLSLSTSSSAADDSSFDFRSNGKTIQTLNLAQIKTKFAPKEITVHDINAQDDVTYTVVPFDKVLESVYGKNWSKQGDLVFKCTDGYQPTLKQQMFAKYHAYLAYARKGDASFSLINKTEGGKKVPLGPFYLVWDTSDKSVLAESVHNWPFQINSVDLKPAAK